MEYSLIYEYFDKHCNVVKDVLPLSVNLAQYEVYGQFVDIYSLCECEHLKLTRFLEKFSVRAIKNKLYPDSSIYTTLNYLTTFNQILSEAQLLQFGVVNSNGRYRYESTTAVARAITNTIVSRKNDTDNVGMITMVLKLFSASKKEKVLAFSKINDCPDIISLYPSCENYMDPYSALKNSIKIIDKCMDNPILPVDQLYLFLTQYYENYLLFLSDTIDDNIPLNAVNNITTILTTFIDVNNMYLITIPNNMINLYIFTRLANVRLAITQIDFLNPAVLILN